MKHNILRRLGALALALALALPMAVTPARAASRVPVTNISITRKVTQLVRDKTHQLSFAITPNNATNKDVTWSSDDDTIASVSDTGLLTANKAGEVTIRLTSVDEPSLADSFKLTVVDPTPMVTLNKTVLSLDEGSAETLTATVLPDNVYPEYKLVTWTSSAPKVAEVGADGTVTALSAGTTYITARCASPKYYSSYAICTVTVVDPTTPSIKLEPAELALFLSESLTLTPEISPAGLVPTWTVTSGKGVVTVENGLITALKTGTATITATVENYRDGKKREAKATCKVTVTDPSSHPVTGLTLNKTDISLPNGDSFKLVPTVSPSNAGIKAVRWESSDDRIVTVDYDGTVTAVAAKGTATITATTLGLNSSGKAITAECKVTVAQPATYVVFNRGDVTTSQGRTELHFKGTDRTRQAGVTITPAETGDVLVWSTDGDASLVRLENWGSTGKNISLPLARRAGEVILTAAMTDPNTKEIRNPGDTEDTEIKAELHIIISGFTLDSTALTMYEGASTVLGVSGSYGEAEGVTGSKLRWESSDQSIVSVTSTGVVNAESKGTAVITATTQDRKYSTACTVTVVEDAGTLVNAGSATAGNAICLSGIASQLNAIARERTGAVMESISGLSVSTAQGVVYDNHRSEADTGAGVGMNDRYVVNGTGTDSLRSLYFRPNRDFSGTARISYTGRSSGREISGVIEVTVKGMTDVTYTADGAPVTFQADDFNLICTTKQGANLKYVTFTPPSATTGTLYYNYASETYPGTKVISTTQYSRTGTPGLSQVTFVPAAGYSGTVRIGYQATDTSNKSYSGTVTINVNKAGGQSAPADIYYTAFQGGSVTFRASDFSSASLRTIGEPLSHVRFSLPSSSEGTLFYNYRGFNDYDSAVISTTDYYQSGTPALSGVAFVPATTASGQTAITYTGYGTRGSTFTGTIYVGEKAGSTQTGSSGPLYSVTVGAAVALNANSFNNDCVAATGADLSYIRFSSLPLSTQGVLYYDYRPSISSNTKASTYTSYYRAGSFGAANIIDKISFLANRDYVGLVTIPYVGYNTNNDSFNGEVTIQVTPNTITYTGTTASPIRVNSSQVRATLNSLMSHEPSYIVFTTLPAAASGRLYTDYNGYGTGTQLKTGVKYYISGTPNIDQISFVPKARYTGDATALYTAYSATGEQVSGQLVFRISTPSGSSHFNDLYSYTWAAPSVDYLYQNDVVKGITATSYGPSQQILRRDFILMLYRAFNFSGGNAAKPGFADVPANSYYAQAVSAAKRMGIVQGDGVNFMPASQITRQDAMVMVKNALTAAGKAPASASATVLDGFPDGGQVSSYARDAVSTLVQMGAVNGSNGYLNPRSPITRAEAAVILHFVMTA